LTEFQKFLLIFNALFVSCILGFVVAIWTQGVSCTMDVDAYPTIDGRYFDI